MRALVSALLITFLMMTVEFIGGFLSSSLALISDAGHMLTDTTALGLALLALLFSRRPATAEKTYGFYRLEILSALFNGVVLSLIAIYIFYEAMLRVIHPREVHSILMLTVAGIGLIANIIGAIIISKGSRENIAIRGAFWHVVSDALSSIGVITGGLIIFFTRAYVADPIIGFLIGIAILRGAWGLIKESVDILLEATPKDINFEEVEKALKEINGVRAIHDLHIWTITSGIRASSVHIVVEDILASECGKILNKINELLKSRFNIEHSTIQFECETCEAIVCPLEKKKQD